MAEREALIRAQNQDTFLANHHHLISPWMYSTPEIERRKQFLFTRGWDACKAKIEGQGS